MTTALPVPLYDPMRDVRIVKEWITGAPPPDHHQHLAKYWGQNNQTNATHRLVWLPEHAREDAERVGFIKEKKTFDPDKLANNPQKMFTGTFVIEWPKKPTIPSVGPFHEKDFVEMTYVPKDWKHTPSGHPIPPPAKAPPANPHTFDSPATDRTGFHEESHKGMEQSLLEKGSSSRPH